MVRISFLYYFRGEWFECQFSIILDMNDNYYVVNNITIFSITSDVKNANLTFLLLQISTALTSILGSESDRIYTELLLMLSRKIILFLNSLTHSHSLTNEV
jgi:hypothetical protein